MIDYETALERIETLDLALGNETVPLKEAAGRVLDCDIAMDRDQPAFDRATMDGYALNPVDGQEAYTVIGTIRAGDQPVYLPDPGEAVRIMTGAPTPKNCTVVPIECTDGGEATVTVADPTHRQPGRNIAWRGEDAQAGEVVVAQGTRLTPPILSACAMAGASELIVTKHPRIAVVTTGDEVGASGEAGIADSNGPLLKSLLGVLGCEVRQEHAADDAAALQAQFVDLLSRFDLVISTGGVSMGDRDFVPKTAEKCGLSTVFHKVAIQPGKPVFLAADDKRALLGLPGNPVSVLVTAHLFLLPLLGRLVPGFHWFWRQERLASDVRAKPKRRFLPATRYEGGVVPVPWNGSGDLLAAAGGEVIVDLAAGTDLMAGDTVRVLPLIGVHEGEGLPLPASRGAAEDRC